MKKWLIILLWIIATIIVLGVVILYIYSISNHSTCNAYTEGYICIEKLVS